MNHTHVTNVFIHDVFDMVRVRQNGWTFFITSTRHFALVVGLKDRDQWRIQDFPRRGAKPKGGATFVWPKFATNCIKMKKIGHGEVRPKIYYTCTSETEKDTDTPYSCVEKEMQGNANIGRSC